MNSLKENKLQLIEEDKTPHLLKYMGSKRELINFITNSIKNLDVNSTWFCDLFSGSAVVSNALKSDYNIHSNDIQEYSSILSYTYLSNLKALIKDTSIFEIKNKVNEFVNEFEKKYSELKSDGSNNYEDVYIMEKGQRELINREFRLGFHFFTKNYSGTYWSLKQCIWIDSIRAVAEQYKGKVEYYAILSSLIFAMSYVSQSTGHFAQYRELTEKNVNDILSYRKREIWPLFEKKFLELTSNLNGITKEFKVTKLDYLDCLRIIEENSIVYADPPYQSVHYSRFYHVLDTLIRYDHPKLLHKARYREDRHQSRFCKRTTVKDAFVGLFEGINMKKSHLVLSYSDTGMIKISEIKKLAKEIFQRKYKFQLLKQKHSHSNMGRSDRKLKSDVVEYLLIFKRI